MREKHELDIFPRTGLQQLFEEQARKTPEAIALWRQGAGLTYRELEVRSNQLAWQLREQGIHSGVIVGIFLERSFEMMIAVLGVLKAGGAYLPLDPILPAERVAFMLRDAEVPMVLTIQKLAGLLPTQSARICLDSDGAQIARRDPSPPPDCTKPEELAYVIYTSGSTGRPKGVLVTHRGVVNHTLSAIQAYALTPADRVLQFASLSFDASAEEIFPTLASGARLVLRTENMIESMRGFLNHTAEWGITVLDLPTAFWHELTRQMESDRLELPASVRLLIIGGERADPRCWQSWRRLVPSRVRLVNTYGPTEATIVATRWESSSDGSGVDGEVPIGRPIENTSAFLFDPQMQPVSPGSVGELYLGGDGLARGYLHQPELTAKQFVQHLGPDGQRVRLYRTGDCARQLPDGNLEFCGRVDDQVKIRGFRIELGEIESVLRQLSGIRDGVVLAREDVAGDKRLVAYFTMQPGVVPVLTEVQSFLARRLPEYMMPALVPLESLPLNANGKIDRKALPPFAPQSGSETETEAAYTETEMVVAKIWREVLSLERIGVGDDFFRIGGHSLLATRVIARLESALGLELPLRSLFDHPSLRQFSAVVEAALLEDLEQNEAAEAASFH